jgi:hypothetical protein
LFGFFYICSLFIGLLKTVHGFYPSGALCATNFVPDKIVSPVTVPSYFIFHMSTFNSFHELSSSARGTLFEKPGSIGSVFLCPSFFLGC